MPRSSLENEVWRRILDQVEEAYRPHGGFARKFARGKLARDPVFRQVATAGLIAPGAHVLDLGCGQGLLASLLRAIASEAESWPAEWAAPPCPVQVTGIDFAERDLERARVALGPDAALVHGDLREVPLPPCDTVVMFDVLHYMTHAEQDALLERVAVALAPRGRLLVRVGDAGERGGYAFSQWIDRLVTLARRSSFAKTHGRSLAAWTEAIARLGFGVEAHPMSQGTPFANVLLVCTRLGRR